MTADASDSEPPQPAPEDCAVSLQNPCGYRQVPARRLRPWIQALIAALEPGARSLTVRFVSDSEMRTLNRTYRGQDKTTDVLSFPADFDAGAPAVDGEAGMPAAGLREVGSAGEGAHLGDIAIAVPTAGRRALAAGHSVTRELRVLILHGVLHCLGHDHETDDGVMERLERRLRRRWIADA